MNFININQYTTKKRQWMRQKGFVCVYVVAPAPEGPSKVGYAVDIQARMKGMQSGNWVKMYVHSALWCAGPPVAHRVEEVSHFKLIDHAIGGEWFNVKPEEAEAVVQKVASELYPSLKFRGHDDMLAMLKTMPLDKRDHVAA